MHGRSLILVAISLAVTSGGAAGQEPAGAFEPVPLSLEEAVAAALERSPALAQAHAALEQAAASRRSAWGDYLPSFDLRYSFQHSNTGQLDPTGQTIAQTSHSAQLSGSYDLFTGFRRGHDLRAAGLRFDAESASVVESEFATVLNVKAAWFEAVASRDLVRVEADRVTRQRDQLAFVARQLALGRATRSDSLRSSVDLNNARLALLTAENAVRQSVFRLAEAIGLDRPVEPEPGAELALATVPISRAEALDLARASSPAVAAAAASALAAEASAAASRAAWWPSLSLSAGQSLRNDDFPPEDRSWSVGVSASYPLFNGFQRESSIRQAAAQAESAQAQLRAVELATVAAVDEAYGQVETARAGVALAEESVTLAREDLRVTEERYRVGLATILDLQASQIALRQAEVDLIQRRFDHALGVARLESLIGRFL
ncbi:MAG TPA: TolC family protein [Gemmatimonadota bacterium]|nr:TolC family protein [Gemmatimonadota bacterium]